MSRHSYTPSIASVTCTKKIENTTARINQLQYFDPSSNSLLTSCALLPPLSSNHFECFRSQLLHTPTAVLHFFASATVLERFLHTLFYHLCLSAWLECGFSTSDLFICLRIEANIAIWVLRALAIKTSSSFLMWS